ncbi:hypothetical protein DEI99_008575 [Curtobacterium sp. MCLR17_036]|uniref:DUF3592 domain-containing protein n=1 Tax=Curtobacterium sp. MCLR17_036 TaxID=2175620 RepID=UPI000DA7B19C|nr:DUF3592 domain-containing protein [Curtobacterium sp. MCLR17_036]WIE66571.1 hypothetical protein DEI99_008575 [Curtobacterium sp. MCLR17_036]
MTDRGRPAGRRGSAWRTIAAGAGFLAAFVVAPLFGAVFVLGAVAGFVADGYRSHQDDEFRAVATATTGTVDEVDVRHFTDGLGPGRTECVPQVTGMANGRPHTWDSVDHAACGDVYEVGRQLQILYDPDDVDHAVLADREAPGVRSRATGVHVQVLLVGVALAAVGAGCWTWLVRSNRRLQRKREQA